MIPRISSPTAARFFLSALGLVGAGTAWAGVGPDGFAFLPCPSRLLADMMCPGCGMTRACLALARGDLAAAWSYNPFSLALVAVVLGAALPTGELRRRLGGVAQRIAPFALCMAVLWWGQRLGWVAL